MYITKKHISRRTLLRGMGAAVALPFLESMVPAQTPLRQTSANPKTRFAGIEIVHGSAGSTQYGTEQHFWSPAKTGSDFEFTPILKPLEPFRDYLSIVSHTDLRPAEAFTPAEEGADHFRASAVYLTAAHPKQTEASDVYAGTSMINCMRKSMARIRRCRRYNCASRTSIRQAPAATTTAVCT
jgi:hypothetical protein